MISKISFLGISIFGRSVALFTYFLVRQFLRSRHHIQADYAIDIVSTVLSVSHGTWGKKCEKGGGSLYMVGCVDILHSHSPPYIRTQGFCQFSLSPSLM